MSEGRYLHLTELYCVLLHLALLPYFGDCAGYTGCIGDCGATVSATVSAAVAATVDVTLDATADGDCGWRLGMATDCG